MFVARAEIWPKVDEVRPVGWGAEDRMVQHIEGFQPESHVQGLPNWKDSRDLSIKLGGCRTAEGISADISVGSIPGARRWRQRRRTPGSDLSEGSLVQISSVRHASSRSQGLVKTDRHSRNEAGAILAYVCEGVIHRRRYVDRRSAHDMHQRGELPVVDE